MATEHHKPEPTGNNHWLAFGRKVEHDVPDPYGPHADLLGVGAIDPHHPAIQREAEHGD